MMRIGIDISQLTYRNTGVANYLKSLIKELVASDPSNEFVFFYSSLRGTLNPEDLPQSKQVTLKKYPIPPAVLSFIWNRLHILPVEWFIGKVDVFITSDWTEPPSQSAHKATILYDLIVYQFPEESTPLIVETQKKKLEWVKKESQAIFCISEATRQDAERLLGINPAKLHIIYPGFSL